MQGQRSIDPLASTIPAAVEAPTLEQSVNEPSLLSQPASMRVIDAFAEILVIAAGKETFSPEQTTPTSRRWSSAIRAL